MNPTKNFGAIIIGAGPSGTSYVCGLTQRKPDMKILIVEKGRPIEKCVCLKCTTKICIGCKSCSTTTDFVRTDALSDGKLSLSPDVGGNLPEVLGYDKTIELLKELGNIYLRLDADTNVYSPDKQKEIEKIRRRIIDASLKLVECPICRLGTEGGYKIYIRLQEHLLTQDVTMEFSTMVKDITIEEDRIKGVLTDKDEARYAPEIVSIIGREGLDWFSHICGDHGIKIQTGTVDVGVHMEVGDEVMKFLSSSLYEVKLVYYTPTFDDKVRTFCTNPSGEVTTEYYENGPAVVNGHVYKSREYKTNNTNFALLVSKNFTKPFNEPIEYGKHITQLSNMLCDGRIMVWTFGNFRRRHCTVEERLCHDNLTLALKDTVPGDLSLIFPHRIMTDIKEMLLTPDEVTLGIVSDETLLYGVEVKFYSNKVITNTNFETSIKGLRAIGDDTSVIRGLQQVFVNGISATRSILKQMEA